MSQNFFRFFVVGLLLITTVSVYSYTNKATVAGDGVTSKEQIATIVEETLNEKPEIVMNAAKKFQENAEKKSNQDRENALKTVKPELDLVKNFPTIGNPEAKIKLYEFLDYNCGYCKITSPVLDKVLEKNKDVQVAILDFPILSPTSEEAARAAIASDIQKKFKPMHDALMAHKGALSKEAIFEIAAKIGLDVEKLKADMKSDAVSKRLDTSRGFGQRLGVNGTPSFLIGQDFIPGAIGEADLNKRIEALRTAK